VDWVYYLQFFQRGSEIVSHFYCGSGPSQEGAVSRLHQYGAYIENDKEVIASHASIKAFRRHDAVGCGRLLLSKGTHGPSCGSAHHIAVVLEPIHDGVTYRVVSVEQILYVDLCTHSPLCKTAPTFMLNVFDDLIIQTGWKGDQKQKFNDYMKDWRKTGEGREYTRFFDNSEAGKAKKGGAPDLY